MPLRQGLMTHCSLRRAMCAEHFSSMALPVAEFLALEHGTEYWGAAAGVKQTSEEPVRVPLPSPGRSATHVDTRMPADHAVS